MSDLERIRDSTDEGELSEGSDRRSASPKQQKKRHEREKESRGEKRKRLADRITYSSGQHSDDESVEMFTIQPGDSKSKNYEKERKEKEKEKEKHKHKHERKEERRDREKDGEEKERHRSKHEERHRRHEERREDRERDKERGKDRDRERKDRDREKDRERREKKNRDGRDAGRKHRRSESSSDDLPVKKEKREKKSSESKEKKEPAAGTLFNTKDRPAKSTEVQEIEHTPPSEHPLEVDESMVIRDTDDVTAFTLDSPAGPKKYSKFDSSPEHDPEDHTPIHSDVEMADSDAEEEDVQEIHDDDPGFDVESAVWEELTEEQKASLTPDSKKRLESEWQQKLIAQLPIFYPGVMGCRNVQEFHCENRIEEGTYGIVFRAKDKRTDEIVALKRLKMEKEREGFPITSLREINMLLKAGNHPNIINVKEVLIGSNMDKIYVCMDFVEHDLKSLMDTMKNRGKSFTVGVQKGLMKQLLSGLKHMHDLWILHRDLKSSNLLLSHKGILKIADFGLAREFGSPLKPYTQIVVTLWYRAPELLLGTKLYSTPIDMWSVGCLMAEFVLMKPLFPGKSEIDEIGKIFLEMGTPNERVWPGYESLPLVKQCSLPQHPHNQLRKKFPGNLLHPSGFQLLNAFLRYDPSKRITAQEGLEHEWFAEEPLPTPPEMFPTFPAKSELHKAPPPSTRPQQPKQEVVVSATTAKLMQELNVRPEKMRNTGFSLKGFTNVKY